MPATGHATGGAVIGATVGLTALAAVATTLRLYTRLRLLRNPGRDDICITIALICSIGMTVTMSTQVVYGLGTHMDTLSAHETKLLLKWFWASVWMYYLSLCFTKCSILLQYLRVFPQKSFRTACHVMLGIVAVYAVWSVLSAFLACVPLARFWDPSVQGYCLPHLPVWFVNAAINISTDTMTAILPLPILHSLQISRRQKIALMLVFGLGGISCLVSILRLPSLYAISRSPDVSWENPLAAIWSNAEVNIGILCSCLPTLKGCISRVFPDLFNGTKYTHSGMVEMQSGAATPSKRSRHLSVPKYESGHGIQRPQRSYHSGDINVVTIVEQKIEDEEQHEEHGQIDSDNVKLVKDSWYPGT